MDIRQLRYFLDVASHENLSKAALHLHIAQPALSRSMRMLEEELGVRLFERHLRGVTLTPEGRELMDRAAFLVRSFDQVKTDIRANHLPANGTVIVGMTPNFALMVGAALTQHVLVQFPGAKLKIVEAYSPDLRDMLRERKIDIAVLSGDVPAPSQTIATEVLFEDQLCLVGRADDPVLDTPRITLAQMANLPLVMTGLLSAGVRNEVETMASKRRVALNVVVEVGSFALATQMILQGVGYTVYVASGVRDIAGQQMLKAVPVNGLWLRRSLAWPIDRPLSRLSGKVLPLVRNHLLTMVKNGSWKGARMINKRGKHVT